MNSRLIYVDNAATTKISEPVLKAMLPYLTSNYANPSSLNSMANEAKKAVETAREQIASTIGALPNEIYFTSCGTEANNWAIKSTAFSHLKEGKNHIITTSIEHPSVLNSCRTLEKQGFNVTYLPVSSKGLISANQIENAITEKTALVSIMFANNEIGTIQPINEIAEVCSKRKVIFHTDAVQAVGHVEINVKKLNVNLLAASGHKINAPKGVGFLYVNKNFNLPNFLDGGGQENRKRGGTENVAGIVALAEAIKNATSKLTEKENKIKLLRDYLIEGILKKVPKTIVNGCLINRLSGNANFAFEGIEGESLVLLLNSMGICASTGSACSSNSLEPSHVLIAIGLKHEIAHGSLRISLSESNTKEEIDCLLEAIPEAVNKLRKISPVWN